MLTTNAAAFQKITFTIPGGAPMTAGQPYVLFVSTSKDQVGAPTGTGGLGFQNTTSYAGGRFWYLNNGPDPAQWTTTPWAFYTQDSDLTFEAVFL